MRKENRKRTRFMSGRLILALTASAFMTAESSAQGLEKFVLTGEAAKRAKTKTEINGETAAQIVQACLDYAKQRNRSVSVFVLSPAGNIVHAQRMDGQGPVNIDTALMKAQTALYMRDSTHAWANRLHNNMATEIRWLKLDQYWVPGGLPILVEDQIIGAIGVGGADIDEECAQAALTSVLGPQPPLAERLPPPAPFPPPGQAQPQR